jgi:hypothetical protein
MNFSTMEHVSKAMFVILILALGRVARAYVRIFG